MRFRKRTDHYFDTETGLEWSLENLGLLLWQEAIDACKNLGNGWRLPTIQELLTLVDYTLIDPATELPGIVPSFYWSSTFFGNDHFYPWFINFDDGHDGWDGKTNHYKVRAVRGGPLKYAG